MSLHPDFLKAIKITEKVFAKIPSLLTIGKTEKELASQIRKLIKSLGGQKESFRIIVASGKRSAMIHGFATDKIIERDDIVMLDLGVLYKKFRTDVTRTYFLGKTSPKQKNIYQLLLKAQKAGASLIKAGRPCKDIDIATRDVITKDGLGKFFRHSTGHGIKFKVHESPRIRTKSRGVLKEGVVITVEPGIYLKGWGGMRVEDMYLVTQKGFKLLTNIPRDFKQVIIR